MNSPNSPTANGDTSRLLDEIEQLRTSLDSALEENSILVEDRDRLRQRLGQVSQELREAHGQIAEVEQRTSELQTQAQRSEMDEELRIAFEELQVLTEELEATNTGLYRSNRELDERVEDRTRQLQDIDRVLRATEASLRSTEASLRAVVDLVPDLLWRADAKGQADWFNRRWTDYTGRDAERSIGLRWIAAVHPSDRDAMEAAWGLAVSRGEVFQRECRLCDANGANRWMLLRAEPMRDDAGRIVRWFAAGTDINDQRLAMEALQRSELRFRVLIDGMPQLVWRADWGGEWTWASSQWSDYTGQDENQARGMGWLEAFHPDDRQEAAEAWRRAQQTGSLEIEGRIFHARENRYRHFRTRALPVRDGSDRVVEWLGTSTDVDDLLQLQQEQVVLVSELQHRTRNLMAVIQSVTGRTLRETSSMPDFKEKIEDRLSALARTQSLLSRREVGSRVSFDLLLREELSAHVDLQSSGERVTLEGPLGVPLRSGTVQTFALALHELVTNAVKYGALSDGHGHLKVCWGLRHDESGAHLWVDWCETGVPDVADPTAPARGGGYGRELIERGLPYQLGARTTYELNPDGVHCTIDVAVPADPASERLTVRN